MIKLSKQIIIYKKKDNINIDSKNCKQKKKKMKIKNKDENKKKRENLCNNFIINKIIKIG